MAEGREALFPTGVTLLRALAVARWLAWGWMVAVVAFSGDALRHPVVAWASVAAAFALTVVSTWLVRTDARRLTSTMFLAAEAALALGLTVLDGWVFEPGHVFVTSQNLASQWPLVAAISIGVSAGPVIAAVFGALVGPARWIGAELNGFERYDPKHAVSLLAISLFYGACGAVFGWMAMLLRRTEAEIADRRARDEVARVLHDTVLQTLALVERRVATTDVELAGAARQADRELRAFLFGADGRPGDDLRSRLHVAVEQGRRRAPATESPPRITVNVIDDDCRVGRPGAGAARPGRRRGRGQRPRARRRRARRRVRRDGRRRSGVRHGARRRRRVRSLDRQRGHGLAESITARMDSIGGRAEVHSTPGAGTEVRLWSARP